MVAIVVSIEIRVGECGWGGLNPVQFSWDIFSII